MYTLPPRLNALESPDAAIDTPFANGDEHLEAHLDRLRLMVQRHMRRFADRLIKRDGSYSDRAVGPQELKRLLGLGLDDASQQWVDQLGVGSAESIALQLGELDARIQERLELSLDPAEGAPIMLPLEAIRLGFGLSRLERDLLLAASAPRLSVDISRLYTVAWTDFSIRQPPASFLAELVARDEEEMRSALAALSDEGRLRRYRLLEPVDQELWGGQTPTLHAAFRVPQRILDYLASIKLAQSGTRGCVLHFEALDPEHLILVDTMRDALDALMTMGPSRARLLGYTSSGRRTALASFAISHQRPLFEVQPNLALLARTPLGFLNELSEILREAQLHASALLLRLDVIHDPALANLFKTQASNIRNLLDPYPNPLFITTANDDQLAVDLCTGLVDVHMGVPPREHQEALWRRALVSHVHPERIPTMSEDLARSYRLNSGSIFRAVKDAAAQSAADRAAEEGPRSDFDPSAGLSTRHLLRAVRKQLNHNLGQLADVITATMSRDEVVLTEDVSAGIDDILAFATHSERVFGEWRFSERGSSGQGLSCMFSGPPGTGKTLMASIIAHELGKVLYRIDLSSVVDKYIGETEKNLGRIFSEAERAQAVLLFDEADSLFAKRTSVKSSNDRYANLEVNYLLQRIDDFRGVTILTTNFAQNVDEAFMRRIRFKLEFAMPDADQRARLWQTLMPPGAPLDDDIGWDHLGESFEFSGGHIRSTVLRAAVYASARDVAIDEDILFDAAVAESREMGLLVRY